jgi:hypothetical protein
MSKNLWTYVKTTTPSHQNILFFSNFFIIILLYWGYIVTFTKVIMLYHNEHFILVITVVSLIFTSPSGDLKLDSTKPIYAVFPYACIRFAQDKDYFIN